MKKYKLIKKYPGLSLKIGDIVEYDIPSSSNIYQYYCVEKNRGISGINPADYPEFWQEVVEKEYEILTVKIEDLINATFEVLNELKELAKTKIPQS